MAERKYKSTTEQRPWEANFRLHKMEKNGKLAEAIREPYESEGLGGLQNKIITIRHPEAQIDQVNSLVDMSELHRQLETDKQLYFSGNPWIHLKTGNNESVFLGLSFQVNSSSVQVRKRDGAGFTDRTIPFNETDYFIIFADLEGDKPSLTIKKASLDLMQEYDLLSVLD